MSEKIADAYVEVHLRDDIDGGLGRVLGKTSKAADRAGTQAGGIFSRSFTRALGKVTSPFTSLFMATLRPGAILAFAGAAGVAAGAFAVFNGAIGDSIKAVDLYQQGLIDPNKMQMFHRQMALMTQTQRDFTMVLIQEMLPALGKLKAAASENMLPGLTKGLRDLATSVMPILEAATARTAKIMGNTFERMGQVFRQASFKKDLDDWLKSIDQFTHSVGTVLVQLTQRVVQFGAEMGPVTAAVGRFVEHVGNGLVGAMGKLAPHADSFARMWDALGRIVEVLLPLFAMLAGHLADLLAPILEVVAGWLEKNKGLLEAMIPVLAGVILVMKGFSIINTVVKYFKAWHTVLKELGLLGEKGGLTKLFNLFKTNLPGLAKFAGIAGALLAVGAAFKWLDDNVTGGKAFNFFNDLGEQAEGKDEGIGAEFLMWMENLKRDLPIVAALFTWFTETWNQSVENFKRIGTDLKIWWDGLWAAVESWLQIKFGPTVQWLADTWNQSVENFKRIGEDFKIWWDGLWAAVESWLQIKFGPTVQWLVDTWNQSVVNLQTAGDTLAGWWNGLWAGIEAGIASAAAYINQQINNVINAINSLIAAYNSIPFLPDVGYIGAVGASVLSGSSARGNAHGGIIGAQSGGNRGGTTMVGEHGPELVRLPYGSSVRSNSDTSRMMGQASKGGQGGSGGAGQITFKGNLDGAFASAFMLLVRSGQIQIG